MEHTDARGAPSLEKPRSRKRLRGRLKPRTRKIIAAALLALVVAIEYRISTVPMATELASALAAPLGSELGTVRYGKGWAGYSYLGRVGEGADVRFDRARLSAETAGLLRALGLEVSEAEAPISWITGSETASKTVFEVRAAEGSTTLSELRLRALPTAGAIEPQLEIQAHGMMLQVLIGAPFTPEDRAAKSTKTLSIAGRKIELPGAVPLKVLVPHGASFRARFSHVDGAKAAEFVLGAIPVHASEESALKARAVGVRKSGPSDRHAYFACGARAGAIAWSGAAPLTLGQCESADQLLTASRLRVSGDNLELAFAGSGWAQRGGEFVGGDLLSRIAQNRVVAGVLVALNLVLSGWLLVELFGHKLGRAGGGWSGGVFISYRREDSASQAGRLSDHLGTHFGGDRVFIDVGAIQLGEDFARKIRDGLTVSDALLAVIGKRWLDARDDAGQRRIDNANDFVRIEIATALERGTWVVPVLVSGAAMPCEHELPEPLVPLARCNAIDISDARFTSDIKTLIEALERGPGDSNVELAISRTEAALQ